MNPNFIQIYPSIWKLKFYVSDKNTTIPHPSKYKLSLQTQLNQTNSIPNTMSTVMNIINQRALVAALTEFGERLGAQLGDACPRDTFQLALAECLKEANLPQQKAKAPKAKVAKGPSKTELKKAELLDQLAQLGGVAPEDDSLKSIRQAISARKKEIKAEEKAAKAAEKKAAKMKAAAEKKAAKKASPKSKDVTQRRLKASDGTDILGENGSFLRVAIHKETRVATKVKEDNWTDEAHARYAELFPEGKDVKKAKIAKKKAAPKAKITKKAKIAKKPKQSAEEKLAAEQQALIAAMVSEAAAEKLEEKTKAPVVVKDDESKTTDVKPPAAEEEEEEGDLEELEEEEMIEDEEIPEFPGEENIEEFEHASLAQYEGVDFYVDEDANVWDENMTFVGKYDEENDVVAIQTDYEPEE